MEKLKERYSEVTRVCKEIAEDFKREFKKCKFCKKNDKEHAYYQHVCRHADTRTHVCVFEQCPIVMGFAK